MRSNRTRLDRFLTTRADIAPGDIGLLLAGGRVLVSTDYVKAFAEGMFFPYEGISTRPAELRILDEHIVEVGLVEGKYHQLKRMFARFQNRLMALQRVAIGNLTLDTTLAAGQYRTVSISSCRCPSSHRPRQRPPQA